VSLEDEQDAIAERYRAQMHVVVGAIALATVLVIWVFWSLHAMSQRDTWSTMFAAAWTVLAVPVGGYELVTGGRRLRAARRKLRDLDEARSLPQARLLK
jgi:hypothetical protein